MLTTGAADGIERLDGLVRARLADSLDSIWRQTCSQIRADSRRRAALLENIRRHTQHPRVFARYYDLALAILESKGEEAQHISDGLLALDSPQISAAVRPFSREELAEDFERISKLLFAEYALERPLAPPDAHMFETMKSLISEANALISEADPRIAREIQVLWPRIYLAIPDDVSRLRFAGVTSFMVWGATFMNVEAFDSPWEVVEFLVHESAHSALFALSCDEALVKNPVNENYASPLRSEPRPMDGIFHATVVCARVFDFNRRSLDLGIIPAVERRPVQARLPGLRESYAAGRKVIQENGNLSDQAWALLDRYDRVLFANA